MKIILVNPSCFQGGVGGFCLPHFKFKRNLNMMHTLMLELARVWAPWSSSFARIFYYFQIDVPWSFRSFRELLFLHINNTMESLLKTASVRVSSIQIIQVRVQNKGKSVWKSRYIGDVSTPPNLNLCLSSSNSVDKLKVIKKNFDKLCLPLLL